MPKRKLIKPSEEALAAIKKAQAQGIPLFEEEAKLVSSSVYHLSYPKLPQDVTTDIGYDGQRRYWDADDSRGPGSLEVPILRQVQEMERDHLTKLAKLARRPPVEAATKARRANSKQVVIEQAWRKYGLDTRHAAKRIAQELGVKAAYVRKVRAKMRLTERMP